MKNIKYILFLLFWLILLADCYLIFKGNTESRIYTKPLLIPLLLLIIYFETGETTHKKSKVILSIAFAFCFFGDALLLKDTLTSYFIGGLSCFLVGHIFFTAFFYRLRTFRQRYFMYIFIAGIIIAMYIIYLLTLLWESTGRQNMQTPVAVYSVIIGFMLLTALNTFNNKRLRHLALIYFIPGALLFVISDSLLAVNKFMYPFQYAGIAIMITYGGAIFLFAYGAMRFLKK